MKQKLPYDSCPDDDRITRLGRRALRELLKFLNKKSRNTYTYHERPKSAAGYGIWSHGNNFENITMVMQGPLYPDYNYTLETLAIYTKIYPGCKLILSTWNDTPRDQLDSIKALGVELVLSEKPEDPGLFNVNMQLVCTANGVKKAHANGAEWIVKTRTDQRMTNADALSYLMVSAKAFPVGPVGKVTKQKYRIFGIGHGSLMYAPYHVTDQTLFGHADDMLLYWTPPLRSTPKAEDKGQSAAELFAERTILELCQHSSPEMYFAIQFLAKLGRPVTWTVEDSWAAYRDHFCFVDYTSTAFHWVKGQTLSLKENCARYDAISNRQEIGFCQWFLLYSGQINCEEGSAYNHNLNDTFNCEITKAP
jgi:WavE lipopolysaccharide synthesis